MNSRTLAFFAVIFLLGNCQAGNKPKDGDPSEIESHGPPQEFGDYWYQGEAELSRFELEQARYGEVHNGEAVMVFVTEPFLTETQVKKEHESDENSVKVLKLNFVRDFTTGIYDYNMMSSIFDPIPGNSFPNAIKISTSSQEWCGHTYLQINNRKEGLEVTGHSYFQDEADESYRLEKAYMEDGIWTRIRIAPLQLPQGKIRMIPGTMFSRLKHKKLKAQVADASLSKAKRNDLPGKNLLKYTVEYPELDRTLRIYFEETFPHDIAGWEETYISGFGEGKKKLTTEAVRTNKIKTDYWNKNRSKFRNYRGKLGVKE